MVGFPDTTYSWLCDKHDKPIPVMACPECMIAGGVRFAPIHTTRPDSADCLVCEHRIDFHIDEWGHCSVDGCSCNEFMSEDF